MFILSDKFSGFFDGFLDLFSVIAIILGILIMTYKNPIFSVLNLIMLFSCISLYLILVDIKFIGISYLLVYVGAVSILFLFILMLLNIRVSELINDTNNNIPLGFIALIAIYLPFSELIPSLNEESINTNNNYFLSYACSYN